MNTDIDTLVIACNSLKDLKNKEGIYKRAALITASKSLAELKSGITEKKAGALGLLATLAVALPAGYYFRKYHRRMGDDVSLALNRVNSDWGQGAVIRYANRLPPKEREHFLTTRLGTASDFSRLHDYADNQLYALKNWHQRRYNRYRAATRGARMLENAKNHSLYDYNHALLGYPGYEHNPIDFWDISDYDRYMI